MRGPARKDGVRRLPQVAMATLAVLGLPILAVSLLRASGTVTEVVPLLIIGMLLSVGTSYLGAALWSARPDSGDVVFADLMLWGWLRRLYLERQVGSAVRLLGLNGSPHRGPGEMSWNRRVRLLKLLVAWLEARHPESSGHSRRVARHAAAIAKRMGLSPSEVARIRTAAAVHDVGKVEVPAALVNKPGRLTDVEFAVVKRHAEVGGQMVSGLGDDELARIVRHHHERIDGGGYPDGLGGEEIPLGARIVAVADTFDAITSNRPYHAPVRHKDALAALSAGAGTQLDEDAVRAFRSYYTGMRPVAIWALLVNAPRQLLPALASEIKVAGAVSAAALVGVAAGDVASHAPRGSAQPAGASPSQTAILAASPGAPAVGQTGGASRSPGQSQGGGRGTAALGRGAKRGAARLGGPSRGGAEVGGAVAGPGGSVTPPGAGSGSGSVGGPGQIPSEIGSAGNGNSGASVVARGVEQASRGSGANGAGLPAPVPEAAVAATAGKAASTVEGAEAPAAVRPITSEAAAHAAPAGLSGK